MLEEGERIGNDDDNEYDNDELLINLLYIVL
jgi:hypothetical protein